MHGVDVIDQTLIRKKERYSWDWNQHGRVEWFVFISEGDFFQKEIE
jgi:hypothetical protein